MFHIVKSTDIYTGQGYSGASCGVVGVEPGKLYSFREDAEADAKKLTALNPIGFTVVEATSGRPTRMISLNCGKCSATISACEADFGRTRPCSQCGAEIKVPWEGKLLPHEHDFIRQFAPLGKPKNGESALRQMLSENAEGAVERAGNWLASPDQAAAHAAVELLRMAQQHARLHARIREIASEFKVPL